MQGRTHTCGELRLSDAGAQVTLAGWYENLRKVSKNLGFLILRDFYGSTQVVIETEEMMAKIEDLNYESTLSIRGTVRERSNKTDTIATGEIEVVPSEIEVLGKCRYNELPFQIARSKEADENIRLKYRYLDLRRPDLQNNLHCAAQQNCGGSADQYDGSRIYGDHNADSDLLVPRGSQGLSGAFPQSSGEILCAPPGAPTVQAAFDGVRV